MNQTLYEQWKKDEQAVFKGWDFEYIAKRIQEDQPAWDYMATARSLISSADCIMDMDTGGGEILSNLIESAKRFTAVENYDPNVLAAKKKLEPLGVTVVKADSSGRLPFQDQSFDLILNRHGAFNSEEIYRLLIKNGIFLTQQVAGDNVRDLIEFFDATFKWSDNILSKAVADFQKAGFRILQAEDWKGKIRFLDVGALVYWLKSIPWIVEGFSVDTHLVYLKKLQSKIENEGSIVFTDSRYLITAKK